MKRGTSFEYPGHAILMPASLLAATAKGGEREMSRLIGKTLSIADIEIGGEAA